MASFTVKNLMDIDDSAADQEGIEARFGRSHIDSDHLGVSLFRYDEGVSFPFGHRHKTQEEAYVVISGSGRIRVDDEIIDLKQWDVVRVAPEAVRGIEGGAGGLEIIAVGNDRPEGGDGEMVHDWWTE
jgi:mannose-6-phosphate isomerase-like protein (cupin superfamily)